MKAYGGSHSAKCRPPACSPNAGKAVKNGKQMGNEIVGKNKQAIDNQ